jgi:hypothetical protein
MDRLLRAIERYDQITADLRILAWYAACTAYLAARGRTHP